MFDWLAGDNLILNLIVLVVGFVALIKGADIFVDGSAAIARKFGVPGVIIGLTVVAMGTSAPELESAYGTRHMCTLKTTPGRQEHPAP